MQNPAGRRVCLLDMDRFAHRSSSFKLALLIISGLLWAPPSYAQQRDIRDAMDIVDDAVRVVRREGGRCERSVKRDLQDLQDDLRDLRRDPNRRGLRRTRRHLRDLQDHARDCPRDLDRKLRRARRAIDDALERLDGDKDRDRDRDRGRDRDRRTKKPKKNTKVPYMSFKKDCLEMWFMYRFIVTTTNKATDRNPVDQLSRVACESGLGAGEQRWPNGRTARFANGEWRYPSGRTAKFANGEWRYPSGRTAKFANGEWRYPNGRTAKFANGQWRYPNGRNAGNWQAVQAWACGKLGKKGCAKLKSEYDSDVGDWRDYALVEAAYRASKR